MGIFSCAATFGADLRGGRELDARWCLEVLCLSYVLYDVFAAIDFCV